MRDLRGGDVGRCFEGRLLLRSALLHDGDDVVVVLLEHDVDGLVLGCHLQLPVGLELVGRGGEGTLLERRCDPPSTARSPLDRCHRTGSARGSPTRGRHRSTRCRPRPSPRRVGRRRRCPPRSASLSSSPQPAASSRAAASAHGMVLRVMCVRMARLSRSTDCRTIAHRTVRTCLPGKGGLTLGQGHPSPDEAVCCLNRRVAPGCRPQAVGTPRDSRRRRTRCSMSSRIGRTASTSRPAGSVSSQSS